MRKKLFHLTQSDEKARDARKQWEATQTVRIESEKKKQRDTAALAQNKTLFKQLIVFENELREMVSQRVERICAKKLEVEEADHASKAFVSEHDLQKWRSIIVLPSLVSTGHFDEDPETAHTQLTEAIELVSLWTSEYRVRLATTEEALLTALL